MGRGGKRICGLDLERARAPKHDWRGATIDPGCIAFDVEHRAEVVVVSLDPSGVRAQVTTLRPYSGSRRSGTYPTPASRLMVLHSAASAGPLLAELGVAVDGSREDQPLPRFEDGIAYDWRGMPIGESSELALPPPNYYSGPRFVVVTEIAPITPSSDPYHPFKLKVEPLDGGRPRWLTNVLAVTVIPPRSPLATTADRELAWKKRSAGVDFCGRSVTVGDLLVTFTSSDDNHPTEIEITTVVGSRMEGTARRGPDRIANPAKTTVSTWRPFVIVDDVSTALPTAPTAEEGESSALLSILAEHGIGAAGTEGNK